MPDDEKPETLAEKRKRNAKVQRELGKALRTGTPYPGATFFLWGETLHYGMWDVKTRSELRGNCIGICRVEDDEPGATATMRRIVRMLNDASR